MAQNDVFAFTMIQQGPSFLQEIVNVLHYQQTTATGDDDGTILANAWLTTAGASWQNVVNVGVALTSLRIRNLTQPQFGIDFPVSPPLAGLRPGEAVPATSAAVLSLRTGLVGRSRRGRHYLAPCSEADQSSGQLSGLYIADLTTYANAIRVVSDLTLSSYNLVVRSEVLLTSFTVTSIVVDQILGTQVRRRPGRGS